MAIQSKMQENYIFIEKNQFHKKLDFQLKKKKKHCFFIRLEACLKGTFINPKTYPRKCL